MLVLINVLCFIRGYLVVVETYVTLFQCIHSIGTINVCTNFEINRYTIDDFRKHAKSYVLFDVT